MKRRVFISKTILVLRGDKELGRIVAGTGTEEIKALIDLGLASS